MPVYAAECYALARKYNKKHPDSIDIAARKLLTVIKASPLREAFLIAAEYQAALNIIYDERHRSTWNTKRQIVKHDPTPKVIVGNSPIVQRAMQCVYDTIFLGGKALGNLFGKELLTVAAQERAIATGHNLNAELCEQLRPLVADQKTVRQCVPAKRIEAIWRRLKEGAAAA